MFFFFFFTIEGKTFQQQDQYNSLKAQMILVYFKNAALFN